MSDNDLLKGYDGVSLPYSVEAEQSVLGAILLDPGCINILATILKPEHFHLSQHRTIFSAVLDMFNNNQPIDFVTLLEQLKKSGEFDETSGKTYLMQLGQIVPSISNVEAYANIVKEKYFLRQLISTSRDIIEDSTGGDADAMLLLDSAEQKIFDIRRGKETDGLVHIQKVLLNAIDRMNLLAGDDREEHLGIPTGIGNLDVVINGLNKSDLILLAARPGMGKTSFALNIARNVAVNAKRSVAFFSLEMTREQLVSRLLSSEAMVENTKLLTGKLQVDEWTRITQAASVLSKTEMYFNDSSAITVAEMKAQLRRLKNVGLVVIDYLQLMSGGKRTDNRVQEISEITRNLKIMAKELDVPVITLSQLSRATENRQGHRPMMSDLRDSGSIEQDADIILFLFREMYYSGENENAGEDLDANSSICIVAKNRHGSTGDVKLHWQGEFTRFTSEEVLHREG